jgi:hypothetical protein
MRTITALLLLSALLATPVIAAEKPGSGPGSTAPSDPLVSTYALAGRVSEVMMIPAGESSYYRSVTVAGAEIAVSESPETLSIEVGDCVEVEGLAVLLDGPVWYRWAESVTQVPCDCVAAN